MSLFFPIQLLQLVYLQYYHSISVTLQSDEIGWPDLTNWCCQKGWFCFPLLLCSSPGLFWCFSDEFSSLSQQRTELHWVTSVLSQWTELSYQGVILVPVLGLTEGKEWGDNKQQLDLLSLCATFHILLLCPSHLERDARCLLNRQNNFCRYNDQVLSLWRVTALNLLIAESKPFHFLSSLSGRGSGDEGQWNTCPGTT